MLAHLPLLSLPHWKALSVSERRAAWRRCVRPLLFLSPVVLTKFALLLSIMWISWLCGAFAAGWFLGVLPLLIFFLADELFEILLVAHYRSRISAALSAVSIPPTVA